MVVAKPNSIKAYSNLTAKIALFDPAEGGRSRPVENNASMLLEFWGKGVSGTIRFTVGMNELAPGSGTGAEIALEKPVALEKGQKFAIREGGRTIERGQVVSMW